MVASTLATKESIRAKIEGLMGKPFHTITSAPVTATDVRRWGMAVYWPERPPRLFWDEEYAKNSRFGSIVAPAEFNPFAWPLDDSGHLALGHLPIWPDMGQIAGDDRGAGLRDPRSKEGFAVRSFSAGNEAEYHAPIRVGDVITGTSEMKGVYEKTGRSGILLFGLNEARLTNQNNELVKLLRHLRVFIFDQPDAPSQGLDQVRVVPTGNPHQEWATPMLFDPKGVSFDQIEEGGTLPIFRRYTDLMNYNRYAAVNDEYVYHHQDPDIANSRGQKDVDGMGLLQFAYLHNMLRQWIGESGDILKFGVQYRANNGRGDIVTCQGKVVRMYQEDGQNLADVDMWTENQSGETLSPGTATVSLPARAS
ncbi:MAG: MaoC family dehydratase N-terminal domain-containing protein [Dehalococcoidia bacterium]|jgi:hypothetical protein|nr:MaoC family dehydratase N-terminal domain-containing protein [Dehalococcoidia bacterium]MDP6226995.1 MaoC family dehydratase N-terminal domain-containing protein [Dehalococcoidia bacterium]MDP7083124.1 MaoC family dehydratase N-terminal domain-containing protein [Dehalococcoidia bacterium]MDP7201715.1 MaoC family dehydratase N-terminal domain-containing protein [Dehalococcoidia bacterium]MDP7509324.1 MaoC family dehydratase N-terminal domain-containing protein [Dehalococcoidia bacterium]|tara:strand:- start:110 stop:1204 length:1095 start_codon:yes stop_codon:yes gene_type:complete